MTARQFSPGFRFSALDGIVLVVGTIACAAATQFDVRIAFVIGFTVVHFFLFCNVFRIARLRELIWAVVFVGLCTATFQTDWPGWIETTALSLVTTVIVVATEMREPYYHGIGWQSINPRLPEWWETQITSRRTETTA